MKRHNMILTGKKQNFYCWKVLPSHQSRIIEQANFTYSPIQKASEKRRKTIDDTAEK